MQLKKLILLLSILISAACSSAFAQDTVGLNTILNKTAKISESHPVEKIYLHFDKPYYAVGDTIWFKAYVTAGLHEPSVLSKIVYVDIYTNSDSLVQTLKLPVVNSVASGDVTLAPLTYKQGNYHLRAYTNYMRNDSPDYFFNKALTIGDLVENNVLTKVSFSGATKDNAAKANAGIYYKDANGTPYANKKVSWRVEVDYDVVAKGKGTTDQNGFLPINIASKQGTALNTGTLFTVIAIGDKKAVTNTFPLRTATATPDLQFFPEGGELITGVRTKVAVKALGPNGLGINVKGTITDNDGKTVADFASTHLGMGAFALMPETGKTYRANVVFADGSKSTVNLPRVSAEGISMSVNNTDANNLFIRIASNDAFLQKNQNKSLYIIGRSGGIICYAAQTTLQALIYSASIPKTKFPSGLVQLTLFSSDGHPINERVTFIQHNDQLGITLSSAKTAYVTREKVKINVTAKNKTQPSEANLSVAVIDESKVPFDENAETTILTYLLLTSDLKGYIEKPNYYFKNPNEQTAADLDILMLTQGYRRFSYEAILAGKYPEITFYPEGGIDITGTLRDLSGMPIARGVVKLQVPDHSFTTQTVTNASGVFIFPKILVRDSSKVVLSAKGNSGSNNMMIMLSGTANQPVNKNPQLPDEIMNIDSSLNTYLQNSKRQYFNTRTLKEVTIRGVAATKKPSHADYPALTGLALWPDQLITGDKLSPCNMFTMCLQGSLLGLMYQDNNFYVRRDYQAGNKTPVQVFVDGMPVDVSYLNSLNATEVESVEVFLKDELSGINRTYGTNGVLEVNMKKVEKKKYSIKDIQDLLPQPSVVTFVPKGYTSSRVFYSPKYEVTKSTMQGFDYRSTIYWNPRIVTDKDGNASFEYYNSDGTGTYRVIAEGIDKDGNIGRFNYRYKVQ
ncbi:carboxypeptidase regulatory-like domain-containing protein [Mucilaginibacter arboris]|uniref:Carboxypeptidase regulatory-like domain-containing protein n=1 Tax=Mucilaginibacter arboris TaxID=2682090 RepID=A0A7K1T005_9SPHI|nr:carboxypeptidase regulatory-like domain-containing protein [Mucilaginibacter arboris]MVN22889.1 carboxypeptidase regulatory-like domain-containing protein [Mucilaginibacter arboris]